MPYNLSKRSIEKYVEIINDYAFKEGVPEKDKKVLLEISEVLDELQIAGAIYKD